MAVDVVATFMGLIIMSFIIERLLEIFSSIIDFACCRKAVTGTTNPLIVFLRQLMIINQKSLIQLNDLYLPRLGFLQPGN